MASVKWQQTFYHFEDQQIHLFFNVIKIDKWINTYLQCYVFSWACNIDAKAKETRRCKFLVWCFLCAGNHLYMYCTCFQSANSIKDGCGNTDVSHQFVKSLNWVMKLDMMGEGCIWLWCSQSCESLNIIYQLNFLCFSLSPGTHDDVIIKVFTARKLRCWRHVHRLYSLCLQLN